MKLGAKIHDRYFGKFILFSDTKLDASAVKRGLGAQPPETRNFKPLSRPWSMNFVTKIQFMIHFGKILNKI